MTNSPYILLTRFPAMKQIDSGNNLFFKRLGNHRIAVKSDLWRILHFVFFHEDISALLSLQTSYSWPQTHESLGQQRQARPQSELLTSRGPSTMAPPPWPAPLLSAAVINSHGVFQVYENSAQMYCLCFKPSR